MTLRMKEFFANTSEEELLKLWEKIKKEEIMTAEEYYKKHCIGFDFDSYESDIFQIGREELKKLIDDGIKSMQSYANHITEEKDKKIFDLKYFILEQDKEIERLKAVIKGRQEVYNTGKLLSELKAKDQLLKEMAECMESFDPSALTDREKQTLSKYKEL